MENFESTTATISNENEKIQKIFKKEANFLKGLMVFAVVQYVVLLSIL